MSSMTFICIWTGLRDFVCNSKNAPEVMLGGIQGKIDPKQAQLLALLFFSLKLHTNIEIIFQKNISEKSLIWIGFWKSRGTEKSEGAVLRLASPHCSDIPGEEMYYNIRLLCVSLGKI